MHWWAHLNLFHHLFWLFAVPDGYVIFKTSFWLVRTGQSHRQEKRLTTTSPEVRAMLGKRCLLAFMYTEVCYVPVPSFLLGACASPLIPSKRPLVIFVKNIKIYSARYKEFSLLKWRAESGNDTLIPTIFLGTSRHPESQSGHLIVAPRLKSMYRCQVWASTSNSRFINFHGSSRSRANSNTSKIK